MNTQKTTDLREFKNILKKHGLKATPQRIAVHETMMKLGHACADMVVDEINSSGTTSVTAASVYNILSQLALLGVYGHRLSANNKMYFDVNTFKHVHMYDCENHVYRDVVDNDLMTIVSEHLGRKKFRGYSIKDIDIQIIVHPTRRKAPKA